MTSKKLAPLANSRFSMFNNALLAEGGGVGKELGWPTPS
jgi:hypothetical protein